MRGFSSFRSLDRYPESMRIALAVEGTRGDVYPLLGLGLELERAGHDVVVCGPPGFRDEVEGRGFAFRGVGTDVHAFLAENGDALGNGGWKAAKVARTYFFEPSSSNSRCWPRLCGTATA